MFIAVNGRPPMAKTSDSELAAAMRPNQRGSSTIGKKSSVWTNALGVEAHHPGVLEASVAREQVGVGRSL